MIKGGQSCGSASLEPHKLTSVDEELIGNTGVIHIVDGTGEQSGEDLQVSEHSLEKDEGREEGRNSSFRNMCADNLSPLCVGLKWSFSLPPEQVWRVRRAWTAPRRQHGCCCGRPHLHGSDPPESS